MPRHLERNDGMKQYPDPTRRRGRPLRNPSQDERTPEEISWWNTHVSDPNRAHAKPLPLDAPLPDKLPNPWLLDTELLLRKLEQCRELVTQIPISNPAATHQGIKIALTTISNLQNDLRFLLHLHREGQRAFARKAEPPKKPAQLAPADAKIIRIKA